MASQTKCYLQSPGEGGEGTANPHAVLGHYLPYFELSFCIAGTTRFRLKISRQGLEYFWGFDQDFC